MKAIGYLRVSDEKQVASGLGLEDQRRSIEQAAQRLGAELVEVHVDGGLSGKLAVEARPGLLAAVADVGRGDVFLVSRRCRLGRDPIVVAMVERLVARRGARIVSAAGEGTEDDSPTSVLMRRIVDAFAEYERLLIGARTTAALRAKRRRGQRAGAVPYGFAADEAGNLSPLADELETLDRIRRWRAEGQSFRSIATRLNTDETPAKRGGRWSHKAVSSVLKTAARVA